MKRALIFTAAVVAFIVLTPVVLFVWVFYIGPMLHPAAPPLLQQVTAGGVILVRALRKIQKK
jgi:hypothetical protein